MRRGAAELSRLRREVETLSQDAASPSSEVWAVLKGDDLQKLRGFIKGPTDGPFEGGVFAIDITVPDEYPFRPPKMSFATRVWHPNISSQTGAICLDILKDAWSPALTLKTTLLSLQALLSTPEPKDPQDAQVAQQYLTNYREWAATAKFWTESYARPPPPAAGAGGSAVGAGGPHEDGVAQLVAMGFVREAAARALRAKNGNVEAALELLFADSG